MVYDTPSSQDTFTHQIWNSYLKEYRRYAPDSMQSLETRSEVKFKVTVTQLWYASLRHTKFENPTSNNIRYALDTIILKNRSEVNVPVTRKWYATLRHPKMYPHTKFGIPTSKNIRDMDRTRKRDGHKNQVKVTVTQKWYVTPCHPKMHLHTKFGIPISKNTGYAPDSIQFQESRSEVKYKVTVTQLWYATLRHLKMHPHTKFEIPTSNNIEICFGHNYSKN